MSEPTSPSQKIYEFYKEQIHNLDPIVQRGEVLNIAGNVMESRGPAASLGELCYIAPGGGKTLGKAEVVGFRDKRVLLMPLQDLAGYHPGSKVITSNEKLNVVVGDGLLGRVLNGMGEPIDGKGPVHSQEKRSIHASPPHPLWRKPIQEPVWSGIKSIDAFTTLGKGQRMGIFAGSGVGKSVLLGMIARNTSADVNVIALIGERGREVREFIERDLGESGLSRSVIIVATSDEIPLIRVKAGLVATTVAEFFRDSGRDVMLMMDSLTRIAMAQREIGLAIGESPTTKGYTPSTYSLMPKLLERAGNTEQGSVTGMYSVLVEGDDINDPVADMARSILDGHIVLDRELANRGHYPAVDPTQSVSRVMPNVTSRQHIKLSQRIIHLLAVHREAEDLVNIGAYVRGSNQEIDDALEHIDKITQFLRQEIDESSPAEKLLQKMTECIHPKEGD